MSFSLEQMLYYYGPSARAGDLRSIWFTTRLQGVRSRLSGTPEA